MKLLVAEKKLSEDFGLGPMQNEDESWGIRKELEYIVSVPNIIGEIKTARLR